MISRAVLLAAGLLISGCSGSQEVDASSNAAPLEWLSEDGQITPWMAWPFSQETQAQFLQTYGQSERDDPLQVHRGLDLAVPAGTDVYSPVAGEVSMLFIAGFYPHARGLAIKTFHRNVEVLVQFLHLDQHSIQFNLGDRVEVGELLGKVHPWPDDEYPSHLHIAMGLGTLYTLGHSDTGSGEDMLMLNPVSLYNENANPLLHLEAPPDLIPPVCLSLNSPVRPVEASFRPGAAPASLPADPFIFRQLYGSPQNWEQNKDQLDPQSLSGLVDIEFALRDLYAPGSDYALSPLTVRLEIHRVGEPDRPPVLQRRLELESTVCGKHQFAERLYLMPPRRMHEEHEAFVFHLTSLNGLGGLEEAPEAWSTEPGEYVVSLFAGDVSHRDVPVAKQTVAVIAN